MDDDGGLFGGLFGDDDNDENVRSKDEPVAVAGAVIVDSSRVDQLPRRKHEGCPFDDPVGKRVEVMYEGTPSLARIMSYEGEDNTYTVIWIDSGVLQYRTRVEDIQWEEVPESPATLSAPPLDPAGASLMTAPSNDPATVVTPVDELWLAARRGSLTAVKRFVEELGVNLNDPGATQERTPFYWSVICGHLDVVEYLLSRGATDPDGTAFIAATKPEVRALLQRRGLTKTGSIGAMTPSTVRRNSGAAKRSKENRLTTSRRARLGARVRAALACVSPFGRRRQQRGDVVVAATATT